MKPDQPTDTRAGEEIDLGKLNEYVQARTDLPLIVSQQQFPGGYSNLTYLLVAKDTSYIIRRPPFGAAIKSAHDMGREFKVLSLLKPHYARVPGPILYCDTSEVIGAPFYIMERISGIILRPSMIKDIHIEPTQMRLISEGLVDNLAVLHGLDIRLTGLDQLGKPDGYIHRQVDGWSQRYVAAATDNIPAMDALAHWLATHQPPESPPTLLHNDYKYDNLVLGQDNLREIRGVLDWEMATVGDPWMDLGATLAYWAEPGDGELAKVFNISWLPGNLTRKEVVERYGEKSGRSTDHILFYYVFGLFKNAVIAQQIYARWKQGYSKDPRFGTLIHVIKDLSRRGMESLNRNIL